ncbi:ATP-binding protein [Streptomyces sp. MA5143a]|uniref:ATP-binding protein n=1 Tax=Streptomyces sp. MA5143a TaxID=2083010 RepID=UPI000D1A604E|nr:ATP-binding protein [Streptomyces sp. MA5143a]
MTALTAATEAPVQSLAESQLVFEAAHAPETACAQRTREDVAAVMRQWDVPGVLVDDVVLVVSELVTNAVQHGTGDVRVRLLNARTRLRIEVTDDNRAPATLRVTGGDDTSGRGLLIVSVLARDWGVTDDGRTTWCAFGIPTSRS